jgi:division protein CdvB (Snf7/Vps24/ESCRT-III family)
VFILSKKFKKRWEEQPKRLKKVMGSKPLKPQVSHALRRIELQNQNIEKYINRYIERDKKIFEEIIKAQQSHDDSRTKVLANELVEVRKQRNLLSHSKLALDSVTLKLNTIFEFGNTVSSVAPVMDAIQGIRKGVSGIMPDVGQELQKIETTLGEIMFDVGETVGTSFNFAPESADAEKILKEASIVAESRTKEQLPSLWNKFPQKSSLILEEDQE